MLFISVDVVFNCTDIVTTTKKFRFILSERSAFQMINSLSVAVYTSTRQMFKSPTVDAEVYEFVY